MFFQIDLKGCDVFQLNLKGLEIFQTWSQEWIEVRIVQQVLRVLKFSEGKLGVREKCFEKNASSGYSTQTKKMTDPLFVA